LRSFYAYGLDYSGGVRVGAADVNGDGRADILTAPGTGIEPQITVRDASSLALLDSFFAYNPLFQDGVYIGGGA
jgi:hypothetical protein